MRSATRGVWRGLRELPWVWGAPAGGLDGPSVERNGDVRVALRAVATTADPEVLYLWLCQLRRAPYSYDWIDNFGRRSPRAPDTSLTDLNVGQSVMTIFTLTNFVPDRSMTVSMKPGRPTQLFGALDVRYDIVPGPEASGSVLSARVRMPPLPGPLGRLRRWGLAWGDLLMMSKQLRTLARLAERTPAVGHRVPGNGGAA